MRVALSILLLVLSIGLEAQVFNTGCCEKNICDQLTVETETVGVSASYGFVGANGTLFSGLNATASRISTGRYQITFQNAKPIANYVVTFGNIDNFSTRDGKHISVINGTQNANGFQVMTMTGDNGTAADILIDSQFNFTVTCEMEVVKSITCQ